MYNYDILKDSFFSMVKLKVLCLKVPVVEIKLHCPILGSLIEKLVLSEFPRQEIISVFVLENNTDVTTWNECKYHFDYDDEQLSLINSRRYLPVDKLSAHMIIPLEHNPTLDFEGTVRTVGRPPKKSYSLVLGDILLLSCTILHRTGTPKLLPSERCKRIIVVLESSS